MRHLVRDWTAANAIGELLGLGVAGAVAIAVASAQVMPPGEAILVVTAAFLVIGAYEGAIAGIAQWIVLRRVLPSLRATHWIVATMIGAVIAWMLGRIPSLVADVQGSGTEPPFPQILLFAALAGAALGVILGTAQWFVLRAHTPRARLWIVANAVAWSAGMPLIFAATSLVTPATPVMMVALMVLIAVTLAGAVVGAIEGAFLRRVLPV